MFYTSSCTNVADLKVLPHEEVEGGAGVGSDGADAAAAAPQQSQTQVGTLLRLLLEQQFRKLQRRRGDTDMMGTRPFRKM